MAPDQPRGRTANHLAGAGDTIRTGDQRIRIANIDTPEMPPRSRCTAEAVMAGSATANLRALIDGAYELKGGREGFGIAESWRNVTE